MGRERGCVIKIAQELLNEILLTLAYCFRMFNRFDRRINIYCPVLVDGLA